MWVIVSTVSGIIYQYNAASGQLTGHKTIWTIRGKV